MAIKQPRVPEYRENEGTEKIIRALVLFLKDFATSVWSANNRRMREIAAIRGDLSDQPGISYPVTSVNGKTGEVELTAADVGAVAKDEAAADSAMLEGKTWAELMLCIYPVGSIYMSMEAENPAQRFGGTWEQLQNAFLLGAGGEFALGSTGGEAAHALTVGEMPAHGHYVEAAAYFNADSSGGYYTGSDEFGIAVKRNIGGTTFDATVDNDSLRYPLIAQSGGSGTAHNNMPPYLAVNIWKRTA